MSNEIYWLTVIEWANLILTGIVLTYLIQTRAAAPQTKIVLDDIAGIRQQMDVDHQETMSHTKNQNEALRWLVDAIDIYILRKRPDLFVIGKPPPKPKDKP